MHMIPDLLNQILWRLRPAIFALRGPSAHSVMHTEIWRATGPEKTLYRLEASPASKRLTDTLLRGPRRQEMTWEVQWLAAVWKVHSSESLLTVCVCVCTHKILERMETFFSHTHTVFYFYKR